MIDYSIYYDQGLSTYILLESNVVSQSYTTSVPLTPDTIYSFRVAARNSVGLSLQSAPISIRAAEIPDAPINLANVPEVTTAYQIGLAWNEGVYNGGSPVLDYKLSFKDESESVFTIYESNIEANTITVTGLMPSVTYQFLVQSRNLVGESSFSA